MFDQSFSADNFRKIFDQENRKGVYLESNFFPEAYEKSKQIKECRRKLRDLRNSSQKKHEKERRLELEERRSELEKKKKEIIIRGSRES